MNEKKYPQVSVNTYGYIYDKLDDLDRLYFVYSMLEIDEKSVSVKRACTTNGESSYYFDSSNAKRIKGSTFVHMEKEHWTKKARAFYITETEKIRVEDTYNRFNTYNIITSKVKTDSDNLILLATLNNLIPDVDNFMKELEKQMEDTLQTTKERAPYIEMELSGKDQSVYFEYGDFWIGFNTHDDKLDFSVSGLSEFDNIPVHYDKDYKTSRPVIEERARKGYIDFALENKIQEIENGYIINNAYYKDIDDYIEERPWERNKLEEDN